MDISKKLENCSCYSKVCSIWTYKVAVKYKNCIRMFYVSLVSVFSLTRTQKGPYHVGNNIQTDCKCLFF